MLQGATASETLHRRIHVSLKGLFINESLLGAMYPPKTGLIRHFREIYTEQDLGEKSHPHVTLCMAGRLYIVTKDICRVGYATVLCLDLWFGHALDHGDICVLPAGLNSKAVGD